MRTMKDSGIEWIGEIPESWDVCRVKNFYSNHKKIVGTNCNDYERLALTMQGVIKRSKNDNEGLQPERFEGYQILERNDIVFKLIDLQNISTSRVGLSPYTGIVSPAYIIISGKNTIQRYEYYYFYAMYLCRIFNDIGSDMVRSCLNASDVLNLPLLKLSNEEKKKIADFLDGKCAEIDELVQTEEKMIEELKAYKQSVITEAVTKGLDPAAPMKDSGVEWIGKTPASWEVGRMKYVADINAPCKDVKQYERISYAPMECIKRGWMECQEISPLESSSGLTTFEENDIVMAKVTPCFENGNIAVAKDLINGVALGSSELFVFRARTVLTEWLFYFLQNSKFTDLAKSTMVGTGGLKRVSPKFVSNYQMGVPSLDEQKQIADYLDEKCAKIDEIIALRTEQINQLKDYKKSLIYEYVTGKKEVV